MSVSSSHSGASIAPSKFFYGWVIVAVCSLALAITWGIGYSYSVFFKPLVAYFNWDRATVSAVYSLFLLVRGAASIGVGWLADRYGPVKMSIFCGFMVGLGLILTSRVSALWQIYVTWGIIEAIGFSGPWVIGTTITSRWFTKNRGLALGIVSSGTGLGTLILVPVAERLISAFGWSMAFVIFGVGASLSLIATAFLLRPGAKEMQNQNGDAKEPATSTINDKKARLVVSQSGVPLITAARSKQMIMIFTIFFLFVFSLQMIIIHLVNYATDVGISPLAAATFVSLIGAVSVAGRLVMGVWSDRIGSNNVVVLCCLLLAISLIWLPFVRTLWAFYLFAILFGFAYGGEVPQMPMLVSQYFGTRAMATLVALTSFVANIGGALGPWEGGKIFDVTLSYQLAFIIAALASLFALVMTFVLKRYSKVPR